MAVNLAFLFCFVFSVKKKSTSGYIAYCNEILIWLVIRLPLLQHLRQLQTPTMNRSGLWGNELLLLRLALLKALACAWHAKRVGQRGQKCRGRGQKEAGTE